ncbi:hypothetical protein Tco_0070232, partial [Tanacetum coccineum]
MPIDPPLPYTDVLEDTIVDIDLLLGEHLDTLSTGDREVDFNPSRDIEELERLLADDLSQSQGFGRNDEGDRDLFFRFSSYAITLRISYDLEDLRACFQSSNHAVS